jgi:predicted enzyme related to lactoylglutathione lyase
MRKPIVPIIVLLVATFLCQVARSEEGDPQRRPETNARPTPQMEEARELTRVLRDLNQDLRAAIAEARRSDRVREAMAEVAKQQQALRNAQSHVEDLIDKAIVAENPDLAEKVAERKALRKKLQELRGGSSRGGMGPPDRDQGPPDAPPSQPAQTVTPKGMDKPIIPTIVHFDVPVDDIERAKKFYTELFGWRMEKMPGSMEYWAIYTTDDKEATAVNGGMMKRMGPSEGFRNYIAVPSVDEYAARVQKLGGRVVVPKMPIPGMGYFAVCLDTENNGFAIWETNPDAR